MLKGQLDKKKVQVKGSMAHNLGGQPSMCKHIKGQPKVTANVNKGITMSMKKTSMKGQLS